MAQYDEQDEFGPRNMRLDAVMPRRAATPFAGQTPDIGGAASGAAGALTGMFGGGGGNIRSQAQRAGLDVPGMGVGENDYSKQAYATRTDDPKIAGVRNMMATPLDGPSNQREATPNLDSQIAGQITGSARGTVGDPTRGALAQYGTGNIEGAQGMSTGGYMGQLEGFNTGQWGTDERGTNSIKNTFGKIASRYDVTQPGATKALMQDPDFQRFFPGAKLVEHPNGDLIDFGDGKPVDVIRAARAGGAGEAWQWGADAGAPAGAGGGGGSYQNLINNIGTGGGDPMADINAQINGIVNGADPQTQALIQQMLRDSQQTPLI